MQKSKGLIVECCQGDTHTLHGEYKLAECNIIHYVQTAKKFIGSLLDISPNHWKWWEQFKGYSSSKPQAKHVIDSAQWAHHGSALQALDSAAAVLRKKDTYHLCWNYDSASRFDGYKVAL